jgi:DNA-binding transcriptional ArsR family regulator
MYGNLNPTVPPSQHRTADFASCYDISTFGEICNSMLESLTTIAAALGDSSRVRIIAALAEGELCACQLTQLLGLAPSTVSRHLTVLRQAGLAESRRDGRWIHYRLATAPGAAAKAALRWVLAHGADDPQLAADNTALAEIRAQPLEDICQTG